MGFIRHTVTVQVFRESTLRLWGFSQPCCTQETPKMSKGQQSLTEGGASNSKVSSLPSLPRNWTRTNPQGPLRVVGLRWPWSERQL